MTAIFKTVVPYAGDAMSLPVRNLEEALPFYETVMGFRILSRGEAMGKSAVLGRDAIRIGLADGLCYCLGQRQI